MVEILVALAVVAVLAGLTFGVSGRVRAAADRTACISNLREIGVALELYLNDNNGRFPDVVLARSRGDDESATLEGALDPYLDEFDAFHCPADHEIFKSTGSSYFWNSSQSGTRRGQGSFLGQEDRLDLLPLVADKEPFHGGKHGTNILYADGRASDKLSFETASR